MSNQVVSPEMAQILDQAHQHIEGIINSLTAIRYGETQDASQMLKAARGMTIELFYDCLAADKQLGKEQQTEQELDYQMQESQDETGTHAPNCRCPWCSAEEV